MSTLFSRIRQVESGESTCKLITLRQTMVPGQRLRLTAPPEMVRLFERDGTPVIVLGVAERGQRATRGVEAILDSAPTFRPIVPGIHPEGTADIVIRAKHRVCDVLEVVEAASISVAQPARVRWVHLDAAPPSERVVARAEALDERVQQWRELVRRACRERTPTHLDDVLQELGPMPEAERPNARALWVAGVINPLPPLGASSSKKVARMGPTVVPEFRPSAMMAESVEARLSSVEMGLKESIRVLRKLLEIEGE